MLPPRRQHALEPTRQCGYRYRLAATQPIPAARFLPWESLTAMDHDYRLRRLRFRAWHRGTREADLIVGGFADRYASGWTEAELCWFEALLDEQDVDVMGWALGSITAPETFAGPMLDAFKRLDYVVIGAR